MDPVTCVILSACSFLILVQVITPKIFQLYPVFKKLSENKKIEAAVRMASTVHGVIASIFSIYVVLFDTEICKDFVWGYSEAAGNSLANTMGYLLADFCLMMWFGFEVSGGSWAYCFHHIGSFYAYYLAISHSFLLRVANIRLLAEFSTLFVNARWCLASLDLKDNKLYFINGVLMTFAFFLCRIAIMPYFYYMAWQVINSKSYESVSFLLHVSWIGVCLMLDVFNCIWFVKMIRGAFKHMNYAESHSTPSKVAANDVYSVVNGAKVKGLGKTSQHDDSKND
ncbi:unnamed protein product [Clavelina lepadiformis]|uniref:TLC domain-containing protein n=1 Tax=Clavelina lepadiformis TaxID=159417 RepID=A0ABP0GDF9_CLALP